MPTNYQLPVGWAGAKFRDVIELKYGKSLPAKKRDGKGFSVYGSNGEVGKHSEPLVMSECLIVGRKGSIGEVHRSKRPCSPIDTTYYVDDFYDLPISFWQNLLIHLPLKEMNRATALPGLNREEAYSLDIQVPPLNEQRRIADKIDALQAKSLRARKALETVGPLLEKFRQSVLAAAFRGDLTAEWRKQHPDVEPAEKLLERIRAERRARWEEAELAKMRAKGKEPKNDKWKAKYTEPEPVDATGLPELPEGWCWCNLDMISWDCGYGTSAKCDYEGSGNPVLRIPNVVGGRISLDDMKFSLSELELFQGDALMNGDFLIVRTNGSSDLIGRGAVVRTVPEGHYFASYLIRYRLLLPELLGGWVSTAWESFAVRSKINLLAASSAGQYNVSLSKLDQVLFPLPPADEIEVLNAMLAAAMGKISPILENVSGAKCDLDRLDQSILTKAFRGELVPQDPNDEPASVLLERIKAEREGVKGKKKRKA